MLQFQKSECMVRTIQLYATSHIWLPRVDSSQSSIPITRSCIRKKIYKAQEVGSKIIRPKYRVLKDSVLTPE